MTPRLGHWIAGLAVMVLLPFVPGLDNDFGRSLLSQMGIASIFALSYYLLLGQTGLLSFGHAVYFGLGGYAAIHLLRAVNAGLPMPVPLVPLAGAFAGLAFGIVFGALTTRRGGTVFALISLGVGELVHSASLMLPGFFGGEEGVTASRTRAPHWLGLDMASQLQVYFVIAFWLVVAALTIHFFLRTPVGRLCVAVRDNAERVEFIGVSPQRIRFISFCVAATFAGLAGGLHAINYEIVAAEAVGATRSGAVLLMVYIGGAGHFVGAIAGACAITWLQISLSGYTSAWMLYLGLIFMVLVLYLPGGLVELVLLHAPLFRRRNRSYVSRAYAFAVVPLLLMLFGAVMLIEMAYRRSTQPEAGSRMTFFGMTLDTSTPWPWLAGLAMALIGGFLVRRNGPRLAAEWRLAAEPVAAR